MMAGEIESAFPRCEWCGDVIGVYDPLVHVAGQTARRTSRAAEPDVADFDGRIYHDACYQLAVEGK
ncbi:MAG TPA: hypothetical protein VFB39_03255 [Solirubrobacteraceae bacterium]|nr:hypothetical protein [Solirubrobacteraceae bacterium]